MIKTIKNKALHELFEKGTTAKINRDMQRRILQKLDALDRATSLEDLDLPGFKTHPLRGFNPTRYAISINGPWRITFEFDNGHAYNVDFEQYH